MPSVSLSPIKEFHIDLVNALHRATILEVKLKEAEEWAKNLDKLEVLTNGDLGPELDEDSELTVDISVITKEKEAKSHDIQQFRAELETILSCLQGHYETPLESFLSAEEEGSVRRYGQQLISWFESIRGHLIEILCRTDVILKEKEEQKKRQREECKFVEEVLDQLAILQEYATKIDRRLNNVAQRQDLNTSSKNKAIPKLPDIMDVDDPPANCRNDFTVLLEDTKTNLREFCASQPMYAVKADSLHDQTTKAFDNAPPAHPITPVCSVEIDAIDLDSNIRQIVVEEFEILYGHFFSSLTEETGKRGEEAVSNLTKTMAEGNKLACKLLFTCLQCDEIEDGSLNGRLDHPSGSDAIALS